jgi:hypothetical protein
VLKFVPTVSVSVSTNEAAEADADVNEVGSHQMWNTDGMVIPLLILRLVLFAEEEINLDVDIPAEGGM